MVERANILPPQSLMGIAQEETRRYILEHDPLFASYKEAVDNYSAYEKLKEEANAKEQAALAEAEKKAAEQKEKQAASATSKKKKQSSVGKAAKKVAKTATNSILSRIGRKIGKAIARGIFGNWL
jgi:FKBP-type peptidyl-prolyl cis-trans isomerase